MKRFGLAWSLPVISFVGFLGLVGLGACGDDNVQPNPTFDAPKLPDGGTAGADSPTIRPDSAVVSPDAALASPDAAPASPDAGSLSGPDAAVGPDAPPSINDIPVNSTVTMTGLSAAVDVIVDTRGAPHIYGASIADVLRVQGYLMSRDRFPQMEFIRRAVLGRLSELAGDLNLGLVAMDTQSRFAGFGRQGQAIYASLAADNPSRLAAEAFVAGVNQYIDEIKAAGQNVSMFVPTDTIVLNLLYTSPKFGHWDPSDIFALGRFQSTSLSFDTGDIDFSRALGKVQQTWGADPTADPRAGSFADFFSIKPARTVYSRDGFNPTKRAAAGAAHRAAPMLAPPVGILDKGRAFFDGQKRILDLLGDSFKGSNNWMVSGNATASGAPILANDPHLSLTSPAVWWYSHINTKRSGGNVNVMGVAFAGIPGVVLGFNDDIAWGATVTNYDVTDVYDETVDVVNGTASAVLFNGNHTPLVNLSETFDTGGGTNATIVLQQTPRGGFIVPGSVDSGHALSLRYTGYEVSNELAYFYGLQTASSVAEARAAQQNFRVGSQNFIVATRTGDISWATISRVPIRDPRALDMTVDAHGVISGHCPIFVLPGTGEFEWTGDVPNDQLPSDLNPTKGFIATANNDPVGVTADGNPCNDLLYLGGRYDLGWRESRIAERLAALIDRGNITSDDIAGVQAETKSSLGEKLRDPVVAVLAGIAAAHDGTFTADELAILADVHDRLAGWTLATPHGVGATVQAEIDDSIDTAIFNTGLMYIIDGAFRDEVDTIGVTPDSEEVAALLERAMTDPTQLATFDADTNDTVLWDDVNTGNVTETKSMIVGRGVLNAMAFLKSKLGADETAWRWGGLHTVIFKSILPIVGEPDHVSIPAADDPLLSAGFPRHGDFGAVDVGNWNLWSASDPMFGPADFRQSSGPSQRLIVELTPGGQKARNALPGGQSFDPASKHHADEAQLWIKNQSPALYFTEADVVTHAESHIRFTAP